MIPKQSFSNLDERLRYCPLCGRRSILEDNIRGELLCSNCGYIIKESEIDPSPEWRAFTKEDRDAKARVGMPSSLAIHDKGLATKLGYGKVDASGRRFTPQERARVKRMQMWDRRSQMQVPMYSNLEKAFFILNGSADKLGVGHNVVEEAAYIYRKALKKNLIKGRSISALIAASLYAACRETHTPRTLKDVAKASGVVKKDVARSYRLLHRELNFKMPVTDSRKCVTRIASKAGIPEKTARKAMGILEDAKTTGMSAGKGPMGQAGAALYVSCLLDDVNVTQKEIADAAGVTEVTIRNRYKTLKNRAKK
ncbi:MAG: transcription initiation factor IIB [Candidatus Methylarchaceae archaeon HK02M2]|nr:transcription initiation factor IIB [Candidatus Methylarchaceae archaeon HK02M2]